MTNEKTRDDPRAVVDAAIAASCLVRTASAKAFQIEKRHATTPDIISHIGAAFQEIFPDSDTH